MKEKQTSRKVILLIKEALKVNNRPFPWLKAITAGLVASFPVIIGSLFGNLQYGLIAALGSFAYLYVFNIPYAQRAKKIFMVVFGLSIVTYLGTISAPYPTAVAMLMGIIVAVVIFIFGALKIAGPSAIFFVLVFSMATGMPINPDEAFLRASLVFVSGCIAWGISMIGWFFNPYGPESTVVKRVYLQLAELFETVGTNRFHEVKHKVMEVLNESEETLSAGYIPWRETEKFKQLYMLNKYANKLFIELVKNFSNEKELLPKQLSKAVRMVGNSIENEKEPEFIQLETKNEHVQAFVTIINDAITILHGANLNIHSIDFHKPSLKTIILGALDKNSIVFISSIRFGIITIFAAFIAFQFELERSYWVPLSCVAVISGVTIVATLYRAIQRFLGTLIGIGIAAVILSFNPSGFRLVLIIFLLTMITELFIVKNYGLAALFFTSNALLMAEKTSEQVFHFTYFAEARFIDIVIGSAIGLIGVYIVGRKSASSRIPHMLSKTLRSQAQFLIVLFSEQDESFNPRNSSERMKMRTNIFNLQTLYNTASGEIPADRKALHYYWPIIYTMKHLSYLLEKCAIEQNRPVLSDEKLAQILYAFETMANAAERQISPKKIPIPTINGFPTIQKEIEFLQNACCLPSNKMKMELA